MGHIWLIGMMGSGKTTIGALVAESTGRPLLDTDGLVVEASGRTIQELFAVSEEAFRSLEREVVASFPDRAPSVVATGGGVVLDDENVGVMRRTGTVVLLDAAIDVLVDRIERCDHGDRPLYGGRDALTVLGDARRVRYLAASDHIVETGGKTPDEVRDEVVRCVST